MKSLFLFLVLFSFNELCCQDALVQQNIKEIIDEATKPYSKTNHPLPLASTWQDGGVLFQHPHNRGTGSFFDLPEQIDLIRKGHHFMPVVGVEDYMTNNIPNDWEFPDSYYNCLSFFNMHNIPITVSMTQWEEAFYLDSHFDSILGLTVKTKSSPFCGADLNNAVKYVSPFGGEEYWGKLGEKWSTTTKLKKMQEIYPNPSLVLMLSNNEAKKLKFCMIDDYSDKPCGSIDTSSDDGKRECMNENYKSRYLNLQKGFKKGFTSLDVASLWNTNMKFIGYDANSLRALGRWENWRNYSTYYEGGKIMEHHKYWDGSSMSYYLIDGNLQMADFKLYSPQVEFMNTEMILEDTRQDNSNFWYEMSVWDGFDCRFSNGQCVELEYDPKYDNDYKSGAEFYSKRSWYKNKYGQNFTSGRYKGFLQFGMWLNRPRVIREFRMGYQSRETVGIDYFDKLLDAVDIVYEDEVLKKFWRKGKLIKNRNFEHPYQASIPNDYKDRDRWFLLDTSKDPERPWKLDTPIPVFSIARVIGEKPNREWLVYAFSPQGEEKKVRIDILEDAPDGKTSVVAKQIIVDVNEKGVFYHIKEDCFSKYIGEKEIANDVLENEDLSVFGKTITSSKKVNANGKATFIARDIHLRTNFWAKKGADFVSKTQACIDGVGDLLSTKSSSQTPFCDTTTSFLPTLEDGYTEKLSNIELYPNPVKDFLTVNFPFENKRGCVISIFDCLGRMVINDKLKYNNTSFTKINLRNLRSGCYVLKILLNKDVIYTNKIIKK